MPLQLFDALLQFDQSLVQRGERAWALLRAVPSGWAYGRTLRNC